MWSNAFKENVQQSLPQPELYGWTKNSDSNYGFDWKCPSVQKLDLETITFLTKCCSCKKGALPNIVDVGREDTHVDLVAAAKTVQIPKLPKTTSSMIQLWPPTQSLLQNQTHAQAVMTQKKKFKKKSYFLNLENSFLFITSLLYVILILFLS